MEYYICENCEKRFLKPSSTEICLESLYGVGDMFIDRNYQECACCPHCESTEIISKTYFYEDDENLTMTTYDELEKIQDEEDLFYELLERGLI